MRLAAFDLEIWKIVDDDFDWIKEWPLGISCAAVAMETNEKLVSNIHIGNISTEFVFWWEPGQMSRQGAQKIVRNLQEIVDGGCTLVTWNGAAFDFRVLAEESGMVKECARLAIDHVDMMYLVVCRKGYFLGLDKAAKGLGVEGKLKTVTLNDGSELEGMHGGRAPELWQQGEYQAVLDYLKEDVRSTLDLANAVALFRLIKWTSNSGKPMQFETEMFTVREALQLPMPYTAWMSDPPDRWEMLDWIPDHILEKL